MFQRNARLNVANAAAAAIALSLINPYIGIFAVRLGADNLQLGYLSALPNLISVLAILGAAAVVARAQHKQRLIAGIFLMGRAAVLGAATIPFFPPEYRVWALIGFWVLAVVPHAAAGSALQALLADVFPGNDRVRALASRQAWTAGAGMIAVVISGFLLDRVLPYPLGYQIAFTLSFFVALAEIYFLLGLKEPSIPVQAGEQAVLPPQVGWSSYLRVFANRTYTHFLIASVLFHFTWQMAWPIFTRFQVSVLLANNTWLSMISVANSLAAVLTFPIWARLAERYGNDRMMPFAAGLLATAPFLTALVPSIQWLVIINLFTGIGVAGVSLLILNNLLGVSPSVGRPVFVAVHTASVALSATLAPIVGALILEAMPIRTGLMLCSLLRVLGAAGFVYINYAAGRRQGNSLETANGGKSSSV